MCRNAVIIVDQSCTKGVCNKHPTETSTSTMREAVSEIMNPEVARGTEVDFIFHPQNNLKMFEEQLYGR